MFLDVDGPVRPRIAGHSPVGARALRSVASLRREPLLDDVCVSGAARRDHRRVPRNPGADLPSCRLFTMESTQQLPASFQHSVGPVPERRALPGRPRCVDVGTATCCASAHRGARRPMPRSGILARPPGSALRSGTGPAQADGLGSVEVAAERVAHFDALREVLAPSRFDRPRGLVVAA